MSNRTASGQENHAIVPNHSVLSCKYFVKMSGILPKYSFYLNEGQITFQVVLISVTLTRYFRPSILRYLFVY